MKNREVADLLYEIADYLEMQDVEWKPRAYRKAARNIEALSEPIEDVHERGALQEIDGVGEGIAEKIAEYLETGGLEYLEELEEELPVNIEALTAVESLGPKKVRKLYEALGIENLDDLEEAAGKGKIADVEGFGEKSQERILSGISMARKGQERMLIGEAEPIAEELRENLSASKNFEKVEIVGSYRRRRETVGDLDVLAVAPDRRKAMEEFCSMEQVKEVLGRGETKSSVMVSGDLQIDLRIVSRDEYGAAILYFTGSKDHNISLRGRAQDRGWKLNEYGLFDGEERLAGKTEEEVYGKLGLDFIPPELREDTGEVEAAATSGLPELVTEQDMKGDLQMHTSYSDGSDSVAEMASKASELGHDYILVTDHGPALQIAGGPQEKEEWEEQREEIEAANQDFPVKVLHGVEANITADGLDLEKEFLETFDLVVASMHNATENPTEKIVEVFEEYPVDIFAHPFNRKIHRREGLALDMARVAEAASENHVAVEINAQPRRLDLPWNYVKKYRDRVKFVVSTDAHSTSELGFMRYGVWQARRGWLEKSDVLNTSPLEELEDFFE
ncbi:MAG: DNA polymerase/3'-5' exonuclease PolX [Candidatus Nanohaloarchaea archaeon]